MSREFRRPLESLAKSSTLRHFCARKIKPFLLVSLSLKEKQQNCTIFTPSVSPSPSLSSVLSLPFRPVITPLSIAHTPWGARDETHPLPLHHCQRVVRLTLIFSLRSNNSGTMYESLIRIPFESSVAASGGPASSIINSFQHFYEELVHWYLSRPIDTGPKSSHDSVHLPQAGQH